MSCEGGEGLLGVGRGFLVGSDSGGIWCRMLVHGFESVGAFVTFLRIMDRSYVK